MASIYEKEPFFVAKKKWEAGSKLPEVYKLQTSDPANKAKAEVYRDSGTYGLEFTLDRTIPDFEAGAEKLNLDWAHSFTEFESCLGGALKSAWKHVLNVHFPEPIDSVEFVPHEQDRSLEENFKRAITLWLQRAQNEKKMRDRQYIYLAPGGDYRFHKELKTKPIDHQHRFDELLRISQMLPAGDIADPNEALQVEWFYNSFHKEDRKEYVKSGRKLADETVESVTEYFTAIYDTQTMMGEIDRKHDSTVRASERRNIVGDFSDRYRRKIERLAEQKSRQRYRESRDSRRSYRDRGADFKGNREKSRGYTAHKSSFKPCHLHGEKAKHTYDECRGNPKNYKRTDERTKEHTYKASNHEKKREKHASHHVSTAKTTGDESDSTTRTSESSRDKSKSSDNESTKHDTYHIVDRVPRKKRSLDVARLADSKKPSKHEKNEKKGFSFLADEFETDFADEYLKDLDLGCSSPIIPEDEYNPLDFGN